MRASADTLLSLLEWGEYMGINPFELAQIGTGFPNPPTPQCNTVFFQFSWQKDFVSREEVAYSIAMAESDIAQQLEYWPAPKYIVGEIPQYPQDHKRYVFAPPFDQRGYAKTVQLRWHKIITPGIFTRTSIGDTANLTLVDRDGDGIVDHFTASIATAVTDPSQIGVYFRSADRFSLPISEEWRIRPVNVSISGGTATITGHVSLLVQPILEDGFNVAVLNATDTAIYVDEVSVYQVYTDSTATDDNPNQGIAIWDIPQDCVSGDCTVQQKALCLTNVDGALGRPAAEFGQPCTWPYQIEPNRLQVNYLAGLPLVNGRMDRTLGRLVAILATAYLASEKCGCERSNKILYHWRQLATDQRAGGNTPGRPYTQREIDSNPFGEPTVGALYVWKQIRNLRDGVAVLVT